MKWDPEQKAAVEIKSKRDSQTKPDEGNVVQIETSLVSSDVLVLDGRGIPVAGLTDKDFVVTEDGVAQKIGMFSPGDDVKLARSIVLIIDYHCAQLPFLSASVAAAKTLIDKLVPGDRMAIVTDDVEVLAGYTNNKRRLKDSLDELIKRTHFDPQAFFEGRNHLPLGRGFDYSALMAVLREAFDDEDQRPIIIFQTDGEEAELLKDSVVVLAVPPGLSSDMNKTAQLHILVYDLMEPLRPKVDRAVLSLAISTTFTPKDFLLTRDGKCRLHPELARRVVDLALNDEVILGTISKAASFLVKSIDQNARKHP